MNKVTKLLPGMVLALAIAVVARLIEGLEETAGVHFIGASVIAMFLGMGVNAVRKPTAATAPASSSRPKRSSSLPSFSWAQA